MPSVGWGIPIPGQRVPRNGRPIPTEWLARSVCAADPVTYQGAEAHPIHQTAQDCADNFAGDIIVFLNML